MVTFMFGKRLRTREDYCAGQMVDDGSVQTIEDFNVIAKLVLTGRKAG